MVVIMATTENSGGDRESDWSAAATAYANIGFRAHAPSRSPPLAQATRNPAPSSSPQYPRNLRSQESTVSYLMHPSDTNGSNMSMIKDDENVDRKASNFIKKVHARNMKDANGRTNFDEFIIPPPPPPHNMLQPSSSY
ncbi:hypothetical protein E3N88_25798 [Mikania micrantha]|uniref:Uncharacterized protein n=1 Tax=Mikania micrantha TaxID=192012 RepID=A0A5N6LJM5_9ASTR|nr:hypothetical protein E3N88_41799 [Mikania micrantha]KAD4385629.1 hypothetical protein E3N88_25798 [Mikania micrantha]